MAPRLQVRAARPGGDPSVRALLEAAFGRTDKEARLFDALATQDPAHDPGLALVAELRGEPVGCALLSPRDFLVRGVELPLAVAAPLAVAPDHRRHGVARALLAAGHAALLERGRPGVVTLGAPELFGRIGYGAAFDMRAVRMPSAYLPDEGDTSAWRALRGEDLAPLCALQREAYAELSGVELRRPCALDWEGQAPGCFTLVHGEVGAPDAYLRFRRRDELEVTECGARDPRGVDAVLRLARRLAREHAVPVVQVTLAPPHAVALALYHRGGMIERCNFGGAAFLGVLDWPALLERLRTWWEPVLAGRRLKLTLAGRALVLGSGPRAGALWIPDGWGPALLTGQRTAQELLFEPTVRANSALDAEGEALVRALFTRRDALWTYSPVYELADD
ncbi:MAG: GNAT family N-acetyltransferase [Planctomycetes bacterium]|nr:GNAT family N-acetyltransferase [Planctomycetota bacterium]